MSQLGRRGFTLIELMIALVILGVVSAGIYRVLLSNQRVYQSQTQRIDLQQNIRAAATILPAELRELDAADGDIQAMSATSVTIRAMRQLAVICSAPVLGGALTGRTFTIRNAPFYGTRAFAVGDSLLIYYEGDPTTRNDDAWALGKITAIAAAVCPAETNAGKVLTADLSLGTNPNAAGAIPNGAPVRGFETVTYKLYLSPTDNRWYVGLENASGTQPLIGPVTATGLSFAYYDASGAVTAVPANVAVVEIRLRGETAQKVQGGPGGGLMTPVDSIATRVALRNNRRF